MESYRVRTHSAVHDLCSGADCSRSNNLCSDVLESFRYMIFYIRFNSDKVEPVSCPTSYYGTSTGLYQELVDKWTLGITPEGMVQVFSILTGRPISDYQTSDDMKLELHILNATKFVYNENLDMLPKQEMFMGYVMNNKLGKLTLGQNMQVKQFMTGKDPRQCISFVLAVYMQPIIDNQPFDYAKAMELEKKISALPIALTYQAGFFFLKRLRRYGSGQTGYLNQIKLITLSTLRNVKLFLKSLRWKH